MNESLAVRQPSAVFTHNPWTHLIGFDAGLKATIDLAKRMASVDDPIFICGETGTGKSAIAKLIHAESPRGNGPFIEIPCSSLNENLIESELFGHVRGAFTGANQSNPGKLFQANHGTVFLDEIGELSMNAQTRLLHFLQEGYFYRVGGNTPECVDVRIIAATHRNLLDQIERRLFREDLYFRLSVMQLNMPSLRQRKEDLLELAESILSDQSAKQHRRIHLSEKAKEQIHQHSWPGNVREVQNVIKRSLIRLNPEDTELNELHFDAFTKTGVTPGHGFHPLLPGFWREPDMTDADREELGKIREALVEFRGSLNKAAEKLGLSRYALYRRLKKFGLNKNDAVTWFALEYDSFVTPSGANNVKKP